MAVTSAGWFYLVYLAPLITYLEYHYRLNFLTALFVFGVIPLLDILVPVDMRNPTKKEEAEIHNSFSYKLVVLLWVPVNMALIIWGAYIFCNAYFETTVSLVSFVIAIGLNGGLGINCAHELMHKNDQLGRLLAQVNLIFVGYGHFYIGMQCVHTPSDCFMLFDDSQLQY